MEVNLAGFLNKIDYRKRVQGWPTITTSSGCRGCFRINHSGHGNPKTIGPARLDHIAFKDARFKLNISSQAGQVEINLKFFKTLIITWSE